MNTFKQAMKDAGLRAVDFRDLMEELTGYRPPAATISRWMRITEDCDRKPDAYDYALALVTVAAMSKDRMRGFKHQIMHGSGK